MNRVGQFIELGRDIDDQQVLINLETVALISRDNKSIFFKFYNDSLEVKVDYNKDNWANILRAVHVFCNQNKGSQ